MSSGFERTLAQIRAQSRSEAEKGRRIERLMKTVFLEDPVYRHRFARVFLWREWAKRRGDFDGTDLGIDLVAEEKDGGVIAVQTKCYGPKSRIYKRHLEPLIAASAKKPFTGRIFVDTAGSWANNAVKLIEGLTPPCQVLRYNDLAQRNFDWPDLDRKTPETLRYTGQRFWLLPHQKEAFDDVLAGFQEHRRGKLIMACGTGKTFTALRIAEAVAGRGGRVLYLVPSISLLQQPCASGRPTRSSRTATSGSARIPGRGGRTRTPRSRS